MRWKEVRAMATDAKTTHSWVQKTPDVCGGDACIRKTRITVWGLVLGRRLGATDARLLENTVGLTPDDLAVAWDYYRRNRIEIDDAIRLNEEP
jgi:type III restriction enzyme